jgi:hypothetical protein
MAENPSEKCPRDHSHYFYHASAYGLAGELIRPVRHSIPTHAATVLGIGGGRGSQRVEKFRFDGVVSFDAAYVEVGGSFDPCHGIHTTFAHSVIEGLNIADMVKADKIVARMAVYSSPADKPGGENSFDITGSHFENLRIAGHKIDVKLATHRFHQCQTHDALEGEYEKTTADDLLCRSKLSQQADLRKLEDEYHALEGLADAADAWKITSKKRARGNEAYWCSAANDMEKYFDKNSELKAFGCFICIPKFGVVRLAELLVFKNLRTLNMIRVQMCSSSDANIGGGGTTGNGSPMPPG